MHELDGTDVETTCGLGRDEQAQVTAQFTRQHHLLLVSARQSCHVGADPLGSDVELGNLLSGKLIEVAELQRSQLDKRRLVISIEHEVLRNGELADQSIFGAVFRDDAASGKATG